MAKRRQFTGQFKAKVVLEALRGDKTIREIAARHRVHPNQVSTWKRQAVEGMADVVARGGKPEGAREAEVNEPRAKIGRVAGRDQELAALKRTRIHLGSAAELSEQREPLHISIAAKKAPAPTTRGPTHGIV